MVVHSLAISFNLRPSDFKTPHVRRVVRILKVARTVADLEGNNDLEPKHLSEAVQYRTLDRNLWL
jgi:predicted ATPase with chaperone activity